MNDELRTAFFDSIADRWDGWEDQPTLAAKLAAGLAELEIGGAQTVLDVGCGTGNLTTALLARLAPDGRVVAIDIAPRMLEVARSKVQDPRASWHLASACGVPLGDGYCDHVLCYSVWPHVDEPRAVAKELWRVLRPGGRLHVWHLLSRARVNEIHASAGPAVSRDLLAPVGETAALFAAEHFRILRATEDDAHYLVIGVKEPA